jgi:ABC-type multidrug transport system ATPase subunit
MQLSIRNLNQQDTRTFWGLRGYTLELKPGVTGLPGPNGAGKSTLMRILATINKPTRGTVVWNGVEVLKTPDALRRTLGYLPQDFGVYPNLSAQEFLEYLAAIKGLEPKAARQRVGIAQALLNDPQLLIVDEPTVGLDPEERGRYGVDDAGCGPQPVVQRPTGKLVYVEHGRAVHPHAGAWRVERLAQVV